MIGSFDSPNEQRHIARETAERAVRVAAESGATEDGTQLIRHFVSEDVIAVGECEKRPRAFGHFTPDTPTFACPTEHIP